MKKRYFNVKMKATLHVRLKVNRMLNFFFTLVEKVRTNFNHFQMKSQCYHVI